MSIKVTDLVYTVAEGDASRNILDGITTEIPEGELVVITGPSGSGKTTFLYALTGILTPTSGDVDVDGFSVCRHTPRERDRFRLEHTAFIFQHLNLFSFLNVSDNVLLSHQLRGVPITRPMRQRVDDLLVELQLGSIADKPIQALSGGEKQRVAIAAAFMSEAPYVFADEPTGSLDRKNGVVFMECLRQRIRRTGETVVLVTHDPMVADYADRRIQISDGRLAA